MVLSCWERQESLITALVLKQACWTGFCVREWGEHLFLDCLCIFFAIYNGFFPWKWSNKTYRQTFYDNCLLQKKITAVNFANHCNLISNWGIMLIKAIRILSFLNPVRTLENCWVFNIMQLTISTQSRLNIPDGILHKGPLSVLPGYTEKDAF